MEIWILGGVIWNFRFGLREKSWKFGFLGWGGYSGTLDLDLGKKVGNLDGGVFWNFRFGLREKSWKFGFGGVFWNFRFGLREKKLEIWIFGMGGYSGTSDLDLGKKVGNLDFWDGVVFWNFGFGLRKKSWKFGFGGVILELRIWT